MSMIEESLKEIQTMSLADIEDYFNAEAQLGPLLFWHLKQRGLTLLLGKAMAKDLEHRFQVNIARNFLFEQSFEKILDHFYREGVEVVVLKGASVFTTGLSHFRDAFVLGDIDLLIRPVDMDRATQTLLSIGYVFTHQQNMDHKIKQGFLGRNNFTRVDLHSDLFWVSFPGTEYRDYFGSDLWNASKLDSVAGRPVRVLSIEDQIGYRLVHDFLGHAGELLNNISRLYYLCALVDFYGKEIHWTDLLQNLTRNGSDRLLLAFMFYGQRELGAPLPPQLKTFNGQARDDLVYLDAVAGSSRRLGNYTPRTTVAFLAANTFQERLKNVFSLLTHSIRTSIRTSIKEGEPKVNLLLPKAVLLQIAAILYVSTYPLRHSKGRDHVR